MAQSNKQIRSFIAIELPQNVKKGLKQIEDKVKREGYAGIKWVNPENIHVTLKFLGNITSEQITGISKALEETTKASCPFNLELAGLGAFPNIEQPRVLWVSLGGEVAKLTKLQRDIDALLVSCGFPIESRPFIPHLTLARFGDGMLPENRRKIGAFIKSVKHETGFLFSAEAISLMRSKLTPTGAIYSCLFTAKL